MHLETLTYTPESDSRPTPLLFVHGMWHGAWCWEDHFLPYFAEQGYVSRALNLRGHGGSEGRERLRWTALADYVEDVAQVALDLPSHPVLIGHSMGGMVVQKYLESHTAPAAVLLASVPPGGVLRTTLKVSLRRPWAFLKANLTLSMFPVVGTPALAQEVCFSADMPQENVLGHFARLQDDSYRAYLDMLGLNLPKPHKVKTPMLVLGAADDTLFSPAEVRRTAKAYGTEAEIVPHMAHCMMLEEGWRQVADRILAWLRGLGL
ncbi:MAG: alpha/beta fold hydrolase [Thermodesulfobacteriota bacterium]